ncbi:MAG: ABC transporter ATP-binding protein [Gammaproteobacteria bacterium]|nr:ABC transporter ATP-binding protein [Gammaproteobacteria bacterium]
MTRILNITNLRVDLATHGKVVSPVGPVDLHLDAGECLGIVGESGSGKSLTLKAILDLLPEGLSRGSGAQQQVAEGGRLVERAPRDSRGHQISLVSQEPGAALDPLMRVGDLIAEIVREHSGCTRAQSKSRAVELLRRVGVPDPENRARFWPHEMSGGLKQRVVISMALACESEILLCDEPTTALDVTIQAQIVDLLHELQKQEGLGILFVTHDLALVRQIADRICVMYAGLVVESGPSAEIFAHPKHPYTRALLAALPDIEASTGELMPIEGSPPSPAEFPPGCRFAPRCPLAGAKCLRAPPVLEPLGSGVRVACFNVEKNP